MKGKRAQKTSAPLAPWPRHHYLSKPGGGCDLIKKQTTPGGWGGGGDVAYKDRARPLSRGFDRGLWGPIASCQNVAQRPLTRTMDTHLSFPNSTGWRLKLSPSKEGVVLHKGGSLLCSAMGSSVVCYV